MALRKFLFQAAEGFHEEQAATDEAAFGKVTLSGVGGVAIDAGNQLISNVAPPVSGTDAANKNYVDGVASGLDWKNSVRVKSSEDFSTYTSSGSGVGKTLTSADDSTAHNTQDGVLLVVGNSILVTTAGGADTTPDSDNGIYTVTTLADGAGQGLVLTRRTDADQNAEVTAGLATFVAEGTTYADTGWVLVTNDTITVDTTALQFTQFTGTGSIIAGKGLLKTGSTIDVELDTGANAQGAGNGGGSSGLEFDTSGAGGKLRAAVHPTGGLDRSASGLEVRIDDSPDTLDSGAAGLKVVGVPLQFKINGTNTSTNVTATNVNRLHDDGATDVVDDLHDHEDTMMVRVASGAIAKGDGVYYSANNVVSTGDCTVDAKSRILGVANAAISNTATGKIKKTGVVTGVLSGATFNTRYFLGSTGQPVLIGSLTGGSRTIQLGIAKNATDLEVQIFDYGKKAS